MGKISKIKLKNIKGKKLGTGKKTKSKDIVKARRKLQRNVRKRLANQGNSKTAKEPEAVIEDVLDMIPDEDLSHLRQENFKNKFYLVKSATEPKSDFRRRNKKQAGIDDDDLEEIYETRHHKVRQTMEEENNFLPIKTVKGFQFPMTSKARMEEMEEEPTLSYSEEVDNDVDSNTEMQEVGESGSQREEVTTAMLLARRKRKFAEYKVRIGVLSSSFLEDPEHRLQNLEGLLAIMGTSEESVALVIPKLAALSLQAIFKDVLPLYPIKHHNQEGAKLKKDTRQLQNFEANLLKKYKMYMQRLEKLVQRYCPKKSNKNIADAEFKLGKVALTCMCRMLESHPYFNLSVNIVNFIIPLLNFWNAEIREIVSNTIRSVFRNDKRGEISYEIVRRINVLVKTKYKPGKDGMMRKDVLDVLLFLRIKEADLLKEKEEEATPGKKMTFEQRKMLSKRQRKKAKELVLLEKELLEASAEENKSRKAHFLTEITKLVFTIYFRALKSTSRSVILTAVLEGLSKFAHVISIEYFEDLLKVLQGFLRDNTMQDRQFLLCVSTVLAVLDGQGSALTMDPTAFHQHLYNALIKLNCGKLQSNVALALRCVRLAGGKKRMPAHRAIAFVKRLSTMSLQMEHHDALATIHQAKAVMRVHPTSAVLLDCDGAGGSAVYLPELEDPDHSGAQSSTLWEMVPLMSHYHPWVSKAALGVVQPEKYEPLPGSLTQLPAEELADALNVTEMEFNPKLKPPKQIRPSKAGKGRIESFKPKTEYFCTEVNLEDV